MEETLALAHDAVCPLSIHTRHHRHRRGGALNAFRPDDAVAVTSVLSVVGFANLKLLHVVRPFFVCLSEALPPVDANIIAYYLPFAQVAK